MGIEIALSLVSLAIGVLLGVSLRIALTGFTGNNGIFGRLRELEAFKNGFDARMQRERHDIIERLAEMQVREDERLRKIEGRLYP